MGKPACRPPGREKMFRLLEKGIALEKQGVRAYLKLAHATRSPTAKNVFIRLAADELDHMETLEKIREAKQGGRPCRVPAVPKEEIEELLPKLKDPCCLPRGEEGTEDLQALRTALDMEDRSMAHYRKIARSASDRKVAELASDLAMWEEFHHDLIKAEIEAIESSGLYFAILQRQLSERP